MRISRHILLLILPLLTVFTACQPTGIHYTVVISLDGNRWAPLQKMSSIIHALLCLNPYLSTL